MWKIFISFYLFTLHFYMHTPFFDFPFLFLLRNFEVILQKILEDVQYIGKLESTAKDQRTRPPARSFAWISGNAFLRISTAIWESFPCLHTTTTRMIKFIIGFRKKKKEKRKKGKRKILGSLIWEISSILLGNSFKGISNILCYLLKEKKKCIKNNKVLMEFGNEQIWKCPFSRTSSK